MPIPSHADANANAGAAASRRGENPYSHPLRPCHPSRAPAALASPSQHDQGLFDAADLSISCSSSSTTTTTTTHGPACSAAHQPQPATRKKKGTKEKKVCWPSQPQEARRVQGRWLALGARPSRDGREQRQENSGWANRPTTSHRIVLHRQSLRSHPCPPPPPVLLPRHGSQTPRRRPRGAAPLHGQLMFSCALILAPLVYSRMPGPPRALASPGAAYYACHPLLSSSQSSHASHASTASPMFPTAALRIAILPPCPLGPQPSAAPPSVHAAPLGRLPAPPARIPVPAARAAAAAHAHT
ncbi:hypothetical protein COCC4DRAFT_145221 [Bipolaris maydis ATCC 48331]|uniref:Uncharacterized protein n=3 Tax=Cochliobolus heterostrophus TaxID=5016 RepID=M2UW54_COCH5|nr:uncharacterized protein COCC4DRAFT_145221 [Bipolaris maydis ATCC 48331]EMD92073.1 hypothetical protein COCHEDRAFT_1029586 [Bipolaris maydis C5]ENI02444.1 hypothetical protein COCC4DRAFT_145221 [Bipolaris maydis ATCC 48331]KAJ5021328.1 hypothetical protein J3E73DRAFT_403176 [Bipolaris maydis]KAJ6210674.1 hypothetical protein PSV09DRAFT_1029586 [Bipolaris maydis]